MKVLIIEDDLNIAELERDYLSLNGYDVKIEADGFKGLVESLTGNYDIVIVDLMLPNKSGYEIIKEVRNKFEIPIIVVSAKTEDISKIRGLDYGADDYLTKPFSPAELLARVKSHINRYKRLKGEEKQQETLLSIGSIEIDTAAHKVYVRGKEIFLTAKEYELLIFLFKNSNIVFTKEQLFDKIWKDESFGDTATVSVHIQKLRKKIEKDPSNPEYIETLWGTGYRFNK